LELSGGDKENPERIRPAAFLPGRGQPGLGQGRPGFWPWGVVSRKFARNQQDNRAAVHDLGLAAGNLLVEATARG